MSAFSQKINLVDTLHGDIIRNYSAVIKKSDTIKSGEYIYYRLDGSKFETGHYRRNKKHGTSTSYHLDGSVFQQCKIWKGVLNGDFISYYAKGEIAETGKYKDGEKKGTWTHYSKNKDILSIGKFLGTSYLVLENDTCAFVIDNNNDTVNTFSGIDSESIFHQLINTYGMNNLKEIHLKTGLWKYEELININKTEFYSKEGILISFTPYREPTLNPRPRPIINK
jgi:antitoxin component YwqK of YwqJK toxin-antitoxin module